MLSTLRTIGEQLLEGRSIWAQLVTEPKLKGRSEKEKWVCPLLFDCIDKKIVLLPGEMQRFYPDESATTFRNVSTALWGPRGKKSAVTVGPKDLYMMSESLFGKGARTESQMLDAMVEFDPSLRESELGQAISEINTELAHLKDELDLKRLTTAVNLDASVEVVLIYAVIRANGIRGGVTTPLFELKGHERYFVGRYGTSTSAKKALDYVTGEVADGVDVPQFKGRYNIQKIFQTTTLNYASGFNGKNFARNFQASPSTVAALDRASDYALNNQIVIAGIPHLTIPKLLHRDLTRLNINDFNLQLKTTSDLLFQAERIDNRTQRAFVDNKLFWVHYVGFESDGNSFKVVHEISDVNNLFLQKLIEEFANTQVEFQDYIADGYAFNLKTLYHIIPVRDPKRSKHNEALQLFKALLERRQIDRSRIFRNFIKLILCHWFRRYRAYPNVRENDSFDFAAREAVFKYAALIYTLRKLNLIDMEAFENEPTSEERRKTLPQDIKAFFTKMSYSPEQESLFFLGRVLSRVGHEQYKKNYKSKPILQKINFNGMDTRSVMRFSLDLAEKAIQHNIQNFTDWDMARFRDAFRQSDWPLTPAENVYYIMAGYTFGMTTNQQKTDKSDNN